MSDSVGKISLDLEITSDLSKQIESVSKSLGSQLESTFTNATKGMFDGINESIAANMKAINDTVKVALDEMKNNSKAAIDSLMEVSRNIKVPEAKAPKTSKTEEPAVAIKEPTTSNVKIPNVTSSLKAGLDNVTQNIRSSITNALSALKNIKMPPISFPKMDIEKPNTSDAVNKTTTRGPPKKTINTEALKAEIDNTASALDIVNAKIEQQQGKLAQLKESYTNAFNPNTKNKIQEQILKTETSINSLISKSDKLGFKLADLDGKFATVGKSAAGTTGKIDSLSSKTGAFNNKINGVSNSSKGLLNPFKSLGSTAKSTGNSFNNMHRGLGNIARQFFTWMIILPMVMKGLEALGSGLLADLNTNDQFANSLAQIKTNLMVAFTPIFYAILPAINALMSALATVTAYIASFVSSVFGKTYQQSFQATQGLVNAKEAMGAYGDSAKKAAKDAKGALMGFDEINQLNKNKDDSSGAGDNSKVPKLVAPSFDMAPIDESLAAMIDNVKAKVQEVANIFKEGFKVGFGDTNFDGIITAAEGIKESLKSIFTDTEVVNASQNFATKVIYNLGQMSGAVASIGVTIAQNLLGGFNLYLQQNAQTVKGYIVDMLNIGSDIATIAGNYATAIADIFSVFRGPTAQQITGDVIAIFDNAAMGTVEIVAKLGRDILNALTRPIIENKDLIKTALENTLVPIQTVTGSISDFVSNTFKKIKQVYDEHVSPLFTSIGTGLSSIFNTLLSGYNTYLAPVFQKLGEEISVLIKEHLQPLMNSFLDLVGKVVDGIKLIWENILVPFINWAINKILPILGPIIEKLGSAFIDFGSLVADVIKGVLDVLGGIIDFLIGVFTGDWEKALEGLKEIFKGIWEIITSIIETFDKYLQDAFTTDWTESFGILGGALNGFLKSCSEIWDGVKEVFAGINEFIQGVFSGDWEKAWSGIKDIFGGIFDIIKGMATAKLNAVIGIINAAINKLNTVSVDVPSWAPIAGGQHFGVNIPNIPYLAKGGIVDSPTLSMIGEAGKEAVVPLENNTEWMDKLATAVGTVVVNSMALQKNNSSSSDNGITGDIIIMCDGVELGRASAKGINKAQKVSGKILLDV
jgi:phage-related protein